MNTQSGAWMLIYCFKTKRFLLGKRSQLVHKPGIWNFFGGHIEVGESPRMAVLRELHEETGLTPADSQIYPLGEGGMSEIGSVYGLREFHYFLMVTQRELTPTLGPEHSHCRWFAPGEFPNDINRPSSVAIEIGLILKAQWLVSQDGLG